VVIDQGMRTSNPNIYARRATHRPPQFRLTCSAPPHPFAAINMTGGGRSPHLTAMPASGVSPTRKSHRWGYSEAEAHHDGISRPTVETTDTRQRSASAWPTSDTRGFIQAGHQRGSGTGSSACRRWPGAAELIQTAVLAIATA